MTVNSTPLADHLAEPTRIGSEISVTGKWVPRSSGLPLFGSGNRANATWRRVQLNNCLIQEVVALRISSRLC